MVLREFLGPADLFEAQTLSIYETMEVIIVHKDENIMLAAFQVVAPYLKDFDNSQKLTVVGLVLDFRWNHFPQIERY